MCSRQTPCKRRCRSCSSNFTCSNKTGMTNASGRVFYSGWSTPTCKAMGMQRCAPAPRSSAAYLQLGSALKLLLGLQQPERSAAGSAPQAQRPPCFQLQIPIEAASLPLFYRTLLLDWVADVSAAQESACSGEHAATFHEVHLQGLGLLRSTFVPEALP